MISGKVIIKHKSGLHLRPAKEICKIATDYECSVKLTMGNSIANGKSIISILGACVKCGTEVELVCDGHGEKEAFEAIMSILNSEKEGD